MYAKGRRKGTVRFSLTPGDGARRVELTGSFNDWQRLPMRRQKDGSFVKVVELAPGTYEYKFLVDGQWRGDPDNGDWAVNPYGTVNSVAIV